MDDKVRGILDSEDLRSAGLEAYIVFDELFCSIVGGHPVLVPINGADGEFDSRIAKSILSCQWMSQKTWEFCEVQESTLGHTHSL